MQELLKQGEKLSIGPVGAGVVVDNELVVCRVLGRLFVWGPALDLCRWMRFLFFRVFPGVLEAADKELAGPGDVNAHVTMHGVFREEVDAELFAGFGEAPLAVEGEDVGENAATAVEVDEVEEFESHVFGRARKGTVDRGAVEVINAGVLVMEGTVEETTTEGVIRKHSGYEGLEFYVAVVELLGYRSGELELVRFEAVTTSAWMATTRIHNDYL